MKRKRKITEYEPISSPATRAYIAGIIDCMATFGIKKSVLETHIAWQCRLIIQTTDMRKIKFLNQTFRVERYMDKSHNFEDAPDSWEGRKAIKKTMAWGAGGAFLDYILSIIDPYIIFNREKIDLIKQFRSTFNGLGPNRVSEDTQNEREIIMEEFRKLQRKYTSPQVK